MSRKKKNLLEQDQAESGASERRPADDANDRDESSPSGSSRSASVRYFGDYGEMSGYLADEIGALDSMRHGDATMDGDIGSEGLSAGADQPAATSQADEAGKANPSDGSGSSEDADKSGDVRSSDASR